MFGTPPDVKRLRDLNEAPLRDAIEAVVSAYNSGTATPEELGKLIENLSEANWLRNKVIPLVSDDSQPVELVLNNIMDALGPDVEALDSEIPIRMKTILTEVKLVEFSRRLLQQAQHEANDIVTA